MMNLLAGSINHNVYHLRCYRQQVTQPFLNSRYSWSGVEIISPSLTYDFELVAVAKFESLFLSVFWITHSGCPRKQASLGRLFRLGDHCPYAL